MFKLTSAAIVALCLATRASARICQSGDQYRDEVVCSEECKCLDYVPSDAEKVEITVSTLGCSSDGTIISKFQLSNQNEESDMSGSLDNLLPASYCVKATLARGKTGFVDSTCVSIGSGIEDNILFQGQSEVTIVAGETQEVRLIMATCAPTFSIQGYAYPTFPSTVVTVSTTFAGAQGSVLGKDGRAFVQFSVENHNFMTPGATHRANKVVVTTDNSGQFDPYNNPAPSWSLCGGNETDCDHDSTVVSTYGDQDNSNYNSDDDDKILTHIIDMEDKEDSQSHYNLTLKVEGASKYATASATIETFAHDLTPNSTKEDKQGSVADIDFVINPVGDLDIQIATATAVRPKIDNQINFAAGYQVPGHYEQVEVTDKDGGTCRYAEEVKSYMCGYEGIDTINEVECYTNGYVVPSDGRSVFLLKNEYIPNSVSRTVHFGAYGHDSDNYYGSSECEFFNFHFEDGFGDLVTSIHIPANSATFLSGTVDLDIYLVVEGINPDIAQTHGYCSLEVLTTTSFYDDENMNQYSYIPDMDSLRTVTFAFIGSQGCENFDPDLPIDFALNRDDFCPALSLIEWGSIDQWASAPACNNNTQAQAPIEFCAFTSQGGGLLNSVQPDYSALDFQLAFYDADDSYNILSSDSYSVEVVQDHKDEQGHHSNTDTPCQSLLNDQEAVEGMRQILHVRVNFIAPPPLCGNSSSYGVAVTATNKGADGGLCSSARNIADFSDAEDKGTALFCKNGYDMSTKVCLPSATESDPESDPRRSARSLLQTAVSGCPEDSIYRCPAENNMPFQINIEDGRLTVSMDPAHFEGKKVTVQTDPRGLLPTRSRFIASDFNKYFDASSQWTTQLKIKVDQLLVDDYLKQNLKPGVTVDDLVSCCSLSVAEAKSVKAAMDNIVAVEQLQAFRPRITFSDDTTSDSDDDTSAQTTSTTSTSTTSEKSDSTLMVVVAVAGILVLVAVIALAMFTMKNNRQSQRVVDMRSGAQQSSWQKGGAMESDF